MEQIDLYLPVDCFPQNQHIDLINAALQEIKLCQRKEN